MATSASVLLVLVACALGHADPAWRVRSRRADSLDAFEAPASPGVTTPTPQIPRPSEKATCRTPLFENLNFTDWSPHPFQYVAGTKCGSTWSKVILTTQCSVTAGRQFDRTMFIYLEDVNLYTGTTQEPSARVSPEWTVEIDVTRFSVLLAHKGEGVVSLPNTVTEVYTGIITCSSFLDFFEASDDFPAPDDLPTHIIPMPPGQINPGENVNLTLSKLPPNVRRASVELVLQNQGEDEFYWSCVPSEYAGVAQACGEGSLRLAFLHLDDETVGALPAYPYVFTGGNDPLLWRPTPGVQTLHILPRYLDLTPWAGALSDGQEHDLKLTIGPKASSFWAVSASLLLWTHEEEALVSGHVTKNTLPSLLIQPIVRADVHQDGGLVTGDVGMEFSGSYVVEATLQIGSDNVTVQQTVSISFENRQSFAINGSVYDNPSRSAFFISNVSQGTSVSALTSMAKTANNGSVATTEAHSKEYFNIKFDSVTRPSMTNVSVLLMDSSAAQEYASSKSNAVAPGYATEIRQQGFAHDVGLFDATANHFLGSDGAWSEQKYEFRDSVDHKFEQEVRSVNNTALPPPAPVVVALQWWVDPVAGSRAPPRD